MLYCAFTWQEYIMIINVYINVPIQVNPQSINYAAEKA